MKRNLLTTVLAVFAMNAFAQNVGIGTSTPVQKLDVIGSIRSSTLTGIGNRFVTADPTGTLNITSAGFLDSTFWKITGNDNTSPTINFIGTINARDFVTKTGGNAAANERMRVLSTGEVIVNNTGIGLNTGDVFSVYSNGTSNGTTGNISAVGPFAINGYASGTGSGLYGENTGTGSGVIGNVNGGLGTAGFATSGTGAYGQSGGANGFGARFYNTNATGTGLLVGGNNLGVTYLVTGSAASFRGQNFGTLAFSNVVSVATNGSAVYGINGKSNIVSYLGGSGVMGVDSTTGSGVIGKNYGIGLDGVYGESGPDGNGVTAFGIVGASSFPYGVYGDAGAGNGSIGIVGNVTAGGATRYGGFFNNDLGASGVKTFLMDDPRDPENKFLKHFSMESPEVLNTYRGNVTLDAGGEGTVVMPDYFQAINNTNCTYHLTPIGAQADLYVKSEIENGVFHIAGGKAGMKVSWMVMSERNDPYMIKYPEEKEVVIAKTGRQIGRYLQPELYGKPASSGIFYKEKIMKRIEAGPQEQKSITLDAQPANTKKLK